MNAPAEADTRDLSAWLRLAWLGLALIAVVLLPFALWGAKLDEAAPGWMLAHDARYLIAALGIALLVADVLLPVPGSVVAVALCWSLGPLAGGACVAIGHLLAFGAGYGLGRALPEARLRGWVGATVWDRARARARRGALWWIVLARPLPLLSEVSAMLAGVLRVPPRLAFLSALVASVAVGALYGIAARLGRGEPEWIATSLAMLALPTASWLAHRLVLRRLARRDAVTTDTEEEP